MIRLDNGYKKFNDINNLKLIYIIALPRTLRATPAPLGMATKIPRTRLLVQIVVNRITWPTYQNNVVSVVLEQHGHIIHKK